MGIKKFSALVIAHVLALIISHSSPKPKVITLDLLGTGWTWASVVPELFFPCTLRHTHPPRNVLFMWFYDLKKFSTKNKSCPMFFVLNYVLLCHRPTKLFTARIIGTATNPSVAFVADQWDPKCHTAGPVSDCKTNKFKYWSSAKPSASIRISDSCVLAWQSWQSLWNSTRQKKNAVERNLFL